MPAEAQALLKLNPRSDVLMHKEYLEENCLPKGDVFCGAHQAGTTQYPPAGRFQSAGYVYSPESSVPGSQHSGFLRNNGPACFSEGGRSDFFPECPKLNRLQAVLQAPTDDIVFIAQYLNEWRAPAVLETIDRLRQAGRTVYLLGDFRFSLSKDRQLNFQSICSGLPPDGDLKKYLLENPFSLDAGYADEVTHWALFISAIEIFSTMGSTILSTAQPATC